MDNERINKPILCLDFDGVCHSYTSGWQGVDNIPDPPVEGLFKFLYKAKDDFVIHIYSTRNKEGIGISAMKEWFSKYFTEFMFAKYPELEDEFEYFMCPKWLYFPTDKQSAFVTLDDRAVTFTGEWPGVSSLLNFKPWNKQE
jgi:hypothetical protein